MCAQGLIKISSLPLFIVCLRRACRRGESEEPGGEGERGTDREEEIFLLHDGGPGDSTHAHTLSLSLLPPHLPLLM